MTTRDYPLVEVAWGREWGAKGLAAFVPAFRITRLSPIFYSALAPVWWVMRWPIWCRVRPHWWTSYGCPTCPTFCARRCGASVPAEKEGECG